MAIEYFLIKTENNESLSEQLASAVTTAGIAATVITEGHLPSAEMTTLRSIGIRAIPSVVAIEGGSKLIETDSPSSLLTFMADAEAALAARDV